MTAKLLLLCVSVLPLAADTTFEFGCITWTTNAGACAAGEPQLFVDVYPVNTQVAFRFRNVGPTQSSIEEVYFDDGSLLGVDSIEGTTGVQFLRLSNAGNLPGGNSLTPKFEPTVGFTAAAISPAPQNGVNPGEWLTITFSLKDGKTYADTIAALRTGDDLRIGIHVTSFQGVNLSGSGAFIATNVVPEPTSVRLLGSDMAFGTVVAFVGWIIRKRRTA